MDAHSIKGEVLEASILHWQNSFSGMLSSACSKHCHKPHEIVMEAMRLLRDEGKGEYIKIHGRKMYAFFPTRKILTDRYYKNPAHFKNGEYTQRLFRGIAGKQTIGIFHTEVFGKYCDHPELYVLDNLENIWYKGKKGKLCEYLCIVQLNEWVEECDLRKFLSLSEIDPKKHYVIMGYSELSNMPPKEQAHWHAHELGDLPNDPNECAIGLSKLAKKFFSQGPPGISLHLIGGLSFIPITINQAYPQQKIFTKTENPQIRLPIKGTEEDYYSYFLELYKLIGPDNLNTKAIRGILIDNQLATDKELIQKSGEPVSPLQLLPLLEEKLSVKRPLTSEIDKIRKIRNEAAHAIHKTAIDTKDLLTRIDQLNKDLWIAARDFAEALEQLRNRD